MAGRSIYYSFHENGARGLPEQSSKLPNELLTEEIYVNHIKSQHFSYILDQKFAAVSCQVGQDGGFWRIFLNTDTVDAVRLGCLRRNGYVLLGMVQ